MTMHVVCENLLQQRQTKYQHVQCVCAVNPSICASDVSDCQITLLCYNPNHRTNVEMPRPGHIPRQMICVFDTEALHGSLCCSSPMCPFSNRPRIHSGLREMLAFEFLSCHFLLLENREMKKEHWPTQIHASIHPPICKTGWVSTPSCPYSLQDYNQAPSWTLLVRQRVHQGGPTQSSGPCFKVVHNQFNLFSLQLKLCSKPQWYLRVLKEFSYWWFKDVLVIKQSQYII